MAQLARLEIDDHSVEALAGQIDEILDYVDMLGQVDTDGIEPTSHAIFLINAFREDAEAGHMEREKSLSNAPDKQDDNFVVPRVIE